MFENPTDEINALRNSVAEIACCSSWVGFHFCLCGQQHPKCERAIRLVYPLFLLEISLFIQPHKHRSKGVRSGVWNRSISVNV